MSAAPEQLAGIAQPWACPDGTLVVSSSADRDVWLAARHSLIGGSEVGQLFGVLPQYGDAYSVWLGKMGKLPPEPTTDVQRRGQVFEDAIVQLWSERFADFPVRTRRQGLMRSRTYPHLGATVDRLSICAHPTTGPSRCVVEVKTAANFEDWQGEEVPTAHQLQGQVQLAATGRDHVHYVVLGPRFQIEHRLVIRDAELIAGMGERIEEWWATHIEGGEAPEPTASALSAIRHSSFRAEDRKVHVLTEDDELHARALAEGLALQAEADLVVGAAQAALMVSMGDATELQWDDGTPVATWRQAKTVDGANAAWRKANPELVQAYSVPVPEHTDLDLAKLVANEPQLIDSGQLRYRRSFKPVRTKA